MKLQCKELQAETDLFTVGRAYHVVSRAPGFLSVEDDTGRQRVFGDVALKATIVRKTDEEPAKYALFRVSHA